MKLKQAILKLPEIDKRWRYSLNNIVAFGKQEVLLAATSVPLNGIDEYHAAAKSFGYEIWWAVKGQSYSYAPQVMVRETGENVIFNYRGNIKSPAKAIEAAFCSAVEHASRGTK